MWLHGAWTMAGAKPQKNAMYVVNQPKQLIQNTTLFKKLRTKPTKSLIQH